MKIIAHRLNTVDLLKASPTKYGVEVDIRSKGPDLIIHHDPFADGELFTEWLRSYRHGTLILNVKEEGLESRLEQLMEQNGISDYFFLDQSFPFLIKSARAGQTKCAVRVSEFESITTALTLANKIEWVWVDCFTHLSLTQVESERLHQAGFKLCLVSPELQGRQAQVEISKMRETLQIRNIVPEAVCTKRPDLWEAQI